MQPGWRKRNASSDLPEITESFRFGGFGEVGVQAQAVAEATGTPGRSVDRETRKWCREMEKTPTLLSIPSPKRLLSGLLQPLYFAKKIYKQLCWCAYRRAVVMYV